MTTARLATIDLPEFGVSDAQPEIPAPTFAARLGALRARAHDAGFDRVVVYADREHSATISWLTGFDPRFEEAVVIVRTDDEDVEPAILVGNECWGTAGAAPLPMRRHLFQDLSLPHQPRTVRGRWPRSSPMRASGRVSTSGSSAGRHTRMRLGSRLQPGSWMSFGA